MYNEKQTLVFGFCVAFILWDFVFVTNYFNNFWIRITIASIALAFYTKILGKITINTILHFDLQKIMIGFLSSVVLFLAFYLGFNLFKSFLEEGAGSVYALSTGSNPITVSMILLLTSFCEEYFWRGYIQNILIKYYKLSGLLLTSLGYAFIHIPTLNVPLIIAALIAGLFWGVIYYRTGSFEIVVLSHIVWTELIFVIFPII